MVICILSRYKYPPLDEPDSNPLDSTGTRGFCPTRLVSLFASGIPRGTRRHCTILFPTAAALARAGAQTTNYVLAFAYLIRGYNVPGRKRSRRWVTLRRRLGTWLFVPLDLSARRLRSHHNSRVSSSLVSAGSKNPTIAMVYRPASRPRGMRGAKKRVIPSNVARRGCALRFDNWILRIERLSDSFEPWNGNVYSRSE